MRRSSELRRAFAAALSGLAGYLDAIGFIKLGGFFVSFMSGNSTRLAVGLVTHARDATIAASLLVIFLLGVTMGALIADISGARRKSAVLGLVASCLVGAAVSESLLASWIGVALLTLAMGAINNVFQRDGEVSIGVTYMTGTLVKLGQHVAAAIRGDRSGSWAPYLIQWLSLITGATVGALTYPIYPAESLWAAALFACVASGSAAFSKELRIPAKHEP